MQTKKTPSQYTIPHATTALLQQLITLLRQKEWLTSEELAHLFKAAADSQPNTDVSSFLADMHAEIRKTSDTQN